MVDINNIIDNGNNTYTINFTVPREEAKKFDSTGYSVRVSVGGVVGSLAGTLEDVTGTITGSVSSPSSFTDGLAYTINGTGFGTKTTAAPLVYDNFESGTLNAGIDGEAPTVESIGSWTWNSVSGGGGSPLSPIYSNGQVRANSTRSSLHQFQQGANETYNCSLTINRNLPNTGDEVYATFWSYYDKINVGNFSRNYKPFVIYGTVVDEPESYVGFGDPAAADGTVRAALIDSSNDLASPGHFGTKQHGGVEGKWVRHECYLKQSDNGIANGKFIYHIHDPAVGVVSQEWDLTKPTRNTNNTWTQFNFGSYVAMDLYTPEVDIYLDQIYFDSTPQRVELGDASTWAACTKREIQPATSWSDSSITITANAGAFSNGTAAYLYVVGADGNPVDTNGQLVTVNI